jgi:ribosomal-protein-alanine N-acetyltransferase
VDDAGELREMILQYAASPYATYDYAWPTEQEDIKKIAEWFASTDDYLAVCLKENGRLVGLVTKNPGADPETREYSLGYIFNFNYHGKGYATEACQALLDYIFYVLEADQVMSGTAIANAPSCRLLARLGFNITGEHISSFHMTEDGNPIEFPSYSFTLTKQAWEDRHCE